MPATRIGLKSFLIAAVCYLTLAAVAALVSHYTGIGAAGTFARTHFYLLGFIAMTVYGLGYSIGPRLGRRPLRFPRWVPVHFWLGNVSLIVMVVAQAYRSTDGMLPWPLILYLSVTIQILLLAAFVVNLWVTLVSSKGFR